MKRAGIAAAAVMLLMLSGCAAKTDGPAEQQTTPAAVTETAGETSAGVTTGAETAPGTDQNEAEEAMRLSIGETEVPVTWEDNASVEALRALCPLTIQMSMYGGFEQVGPIGQSLVRNDVPTVTDFGDIVLYAGNRIVIFYGSNSWEYTRLGHIGLSRQEMTDLLGREDVVITLE